jgi:dihydrofolate reductase
MGNLIYSAIASLDGYVEDLAGGFEWATPDEEVLRFVNDLERPIGTYLFGRRMYETMLYWETAHTIPDQSPLGRDFTDIWQAAEKIVYSRSLHDVSSARTRIERSFDPETVHRLKTTSAHDMTVGGAELAGQALTSGIVDELQLFTVPVLVGGGKPWIPDGIRLDLELLDTHRFEGGVIFLRYRPKP